MSNSPPPQSIPQLNGVTNTGRLVTFIAGEHNQTLPQKEKAPNAEPVSRGEDPPVAQPVPAGSAAIITADGLNIEPFAADQLSNPASIDVDDRGRVWVAEALNYRKKIRQQGDRILILQDSDGDGRADSTKVFYQDPDIDGVHGVCVLGNKAIVSAPDRIHCSHRYRWRRQGRRKEVAVHGQSHDRLTWST